MKASSHKIDQSNSFIEKEEQAFDFDQALWKKFKNGDESAFITIYQKNVQKLFRVGLKFSTDRNLIKDCLQDFFIEILQRRQNLADVENIYLYLFISFRRKLLGYLKKKKKSPIESGMINPEFQFAEELDAEKKLINAQWSESQIKKLNQAINQLEVKEREIIYYFYYQNLSYQEISKILNYNQVSSARRLLYKALSKIRTNFQ